MAVPTTDLARSSAPPPVLADRPREARARPGWGFDLAALIGLVALALAARLPGLQTVPRFTDEQLDVLYTLPLYRLQALPLVGFDPYNGPLFSYLLAVLLWIVGPQPFAPRLLPLLLGVGAVVATYFLGRALGGRLAGLVAGGLLATSAAHVVVNSHVAWSNATTPFFTTLAFLAILPAVTRASGPHLALGGLAFGVALQTHPSVVALLPGAGLAVLLRRPRLALSRWTVLAGLLFVLGYGNMLAYNLLPRGDDPYRLLARNHVPAVQDTPQDTLARLSHEEKVNAEGSSGLAAYPRNLAALAINLPRLAASQVEPRSGPTDYLGSPAFWLYGLLVLVGLAWPLRHGNLLPLVAGGGFLLLLPLFNGKYEPIFNGRYLMPVLPLAFAGVGLVVADLRHAVVGRLTRPGLALAIALLALYPLVALISYHQRNAPEGQINFDLVQTAAAVDTARRPDEPILLDEALGRRGLPGDGDLLLNLRVFLEFRQVPFRVGPATAGKLEAELGSARTAIVVIAQPYDRALDARYRFVQLEEKTSGRYAAFRLERKP